MDDKLAIILLTTLLPAFVVAYVLRTNGKTLNFAVFGGTLVYVLSIVMIYAFIYLADYMNMRADDLVLLLPLLVAGLVFFLLRGSSIGDQK